MDFSWGLHIQIANIATANFRPVRTDASSHFSLSPTVLTKAAANDVAAGLVPFFLCGTILNLKAPLLSLKIFLLIGMWQKFPYFG
jgi:hypothetical protein